MATHNVPRFEEIKARVEALGCKLIEVEGSKGSFRIFDADSEAEGMTIGEVSDWCVDRETDIADGKASATVTKLRARVRALGFELVQNNDKEDPSYFVLDPATHTLVDEPDGGTELKFIADWCVDRETDIADGRITGSVATRDERFLSMLVAAGLKDRLRAMEIRKAEGIEKALTFLNDCTLSAEHEAPAPRSARGIELLDGAIKTVAMLHDRCPDADTCATLAMLEHVLCAVEDDL